MEKNAKSDDISEDKLDPYAPMAASFNRLKGPIQELLHSHDNLVLQNLRIMNDLKDLQSFRKNIETAIGKRDQGA